MKKWRYCEETELPRNDFLEMEKKMNIIEKVFGTHSQREIKMIMPLVEKVEALKPQMMALSDEELKAKTQ